MHKLQNYKSKTSNGFRHHRAMQGVQRDNHSHYLNHPWTLCILNFPSSSQIQISIIPDVPRIIPLKVCIPNTHLQKQCNTNLEELQISLRLSFNMTVGKHPLRNTESTKCLIPFIKAHT